ncbi:hypothetical protein BGZ51_000998 [Haplosporangium sp. Z 767]|nr:hypothetical protein BGZ51_000998 [Haplosporangium sp. Z 767]KAF9190006.1 hypothetical protein BGZ50_000470 [Haplosporangium sp. Z 11]
MDTFDRPIYKPDAIESVSLFISLVCISLMSLLFGRKTAGTKFSTLNYARGLVVSLYLVSWLFSLMAAMLVQTNNFNLLSCQLSIFTCIVLYASSKVIIYLFLAERVYVVTAVGVTRWNSKLYKFNLFLVTPYGIVFILAIIYRVAKLTRSGECQIGLLRPAAVPFIVYDILISSWLTAVFIHSLMSSTSMLQGPTKHKLREVARRTLLGSLIALVLSCANISTLVYFQGQERGLMCLATCTLDVTLNAIAIHWVTSRGGSKNSSNKRGISSNNGDRHSRVGQQFGMQGIDKQVSPIESHISVSIESYVEEYHQLHYGPKSTTSPHYYTPHSEQ